jgi:hypothetical protein
VVAVVAVVVIRAPGAIVPDRMARPLLHLTENQDPLIQLMAEVAEVAEVDSMGVPGAAAMGVHMADGRVQATLAAKQVTRAPAGVSAIQVDSHPTAEHPVGNRVSLFRIM